MAHVKPLQEEYRRWAISLITEEWGSPRIVARGRLYNPAELSGIIAVDHGKPTGLLLYMIENTQCDIISLNSLVENKGIGSALVQSVIDTAKAAGCHSVRLITTNDNLGALRFYQKRGFAIVAVYPDAMEISRKLKPEIPLIGNDGIPLRDEIELVFRFLI